MLEFVKKKIMEWIVSIVIVLITASLYNYFTNKREYQSSIQKQIGSKADMQYVKEKNAELKDYSDRQDENLKETLKQHIEESKQATIQQTEWIKSVDRKLNILVQNKK